MTVVELMPPPAERRERLKELEAVIAAGWERVVEVGRALREIRDSKPPLYKELDEGLTFEQYCATRWSLNRARPYQYIDAAEIHEATSTFVENAVPILTETTARELAPLLRSGGHQAVAEAWSKVSNRFRDQRPPTAREVHQVLVEEGYREPSFSVSSGKVNRRVRLGQFGDRLIAAEKRLEWFVVKEIGDRPLAKTDKQLAADYAEKCDAMARRLREIAT